MILRIIVSFAAAIGLVTCCSGALQPEEIVIVAARGSRESEGLAALLRPCSRRTDKKPLPGGSAGRRSTTS